MILTLTNIRQHENLTIEIPNSGIVRLYGKSGIGKTTIFDAIEEALYGSASDISSWGTSKSSVELVLDILNITISRTRGPQTLTVTYCNNTYKDDEAQELINQLLGMTEQEFLACSYIKQGSANSLLSFGPADQLRFVESLSIGSANPESIKKKIKDLIDDAATKVSICQYKESELISKIDDIDNKINSLSESLGEKPSMSLSVDEANKIKVDLLEQKKNLRGLGAFITEAHRAIQNPIYDLIKNSESILQEKRSKINQLSSMIIGDKDELKDLYWSEESVGKLNEEIKLITEQKSYLLVKKQIKDLSLDIVKEYQDVKEYGSITNLLAAKKDQYKQDVESINKQKAQKQSQLNELNNLSIPQHCPSCNTPLAIVASKIVASVDLPSDLGAIKANLIEVIKGLSNEIATANHQSDMVTTWATKGLLLKSKLPAVEPYPSIATIDEADKKLYDCNTGITRNTVIQNKINATEANINKCRKAIVVIESEIAKVESELLTANTDKTQEYWIDKEKSETAEYHKLQALIYTNEDILKVYENELKSLESFNKIEKVLIDLKAEHHEQISKLSQIKISLDESIGELAAAKRLKELSDFAAVAAIDSTLEDINACSAYFLEKMFPDDGTSIKLKNSTTTKSGDDRAKLSLEIFHKGKVAKRLSNLSGGEKSRACLAFQLGLSELYKSPMLLIDEGFSGLGDEDKEQCLEILHDIVKDKLILVIEHGAGSSHFDNTLTIG